jgi:uncharacterized membrane protein
VSVTDAFRDKVATVVYGMLVGGTGTALAFVVGTIQNAGAEIRGAIADAGLALEGVGRTAGAELMGVNYAIRSVFINVGMTGGIAAPVASATMFVISIGLFVGFVSAAIFIAKLVTWK